MSDEQIIIEVKDKVDKGIATQLKTIANNARDAHKAIEQMQTAMDKVSGKSVDQATQSVSKLKDELSQLNTGLDKVPGKVDNTTVSFKGLTSGISGTTAAIALFGFAAVAAGTAMVRATEQVGPLLSRLKLVSDTTGQANQTLAALYETAQNARVNFVELGGTYQQLARSGREFGLSQESLLRINETIAKSLTISGTSAASASAALTQLSQGFASGTLRGEELNSVMEQTPRLAQAIADGLGVSVGQLRKMGQEGQLTAEKVAEALQKAAASVDKEFAQMGTTVSGEMTKLTNAATMFWSELDKTIGVSKAVANSIGFITRAVEQMTRALKDAQLADESRRGTPQAGFSGTGGGAATGGLRIGKPQNTDLFAAVQRAGVNMGDYGSFVTNTEKADKALEKFVGDGKHLTDLEEFRKKVSEVTAEFKALPPELQESAKAQAVYNARVKELQDAYQKKATSGDRSAAKKANAELKKEQAEALKLENSRYDRLADLGKAAAQELLMYDKQTAAIKAYNDALTSANQTRRDQIDLQVASVGMGSRQAEEYARLFEVDRDYQKKRLELVKEYDTKLASAKTAEEKDNAKTIYDSNLANLQSYYDTRVSMELDANERILKAQGQWQNGAIRALQNYQNEAANIAQLTDNAFTNAFKGAEDAVVSFVTNSKFSFKSFADSVIADLARIAAKQAIAGLAGALTNSFFSSSIGQSMAPTAGPSAPGGYTFNSGSLAGTGSWATGGYTGDMAADQVAGVVHGREFVFDAQATAYYGPDNLMAMMSAAGRSGASAAMPTGGGSGGSGGPTIAMNVEIINTASGQVQASAEQGKDENGQPNLKILIRQIESEMAGNVQSGTGPMFKAISNSFNVKPTPGNQ